MTGVDVSHLHDGSFLMDQKACGRHRSSGNQFRVTEDARGICDRTKKSTLRGLCESDAMAVHSRAVSMLQSSLPMATVGTLMKSNRIFKELKLDLVEITSACTP